MADQEVADRDAAGTSRGEPAAGTPAAGTPADDAPAASPSGADSTPDARIERFLGDPTRDPADWRWLWEGDHPFPVRSHRGFLGRVAVFAKRLLRPWVRLPVADLWDRQRVYNLIVLEELARMRQLDQRVGDLDAHLRRVHADHQTAIEAHARRLEGLDVRTADGLRDVMNHNDALFARVDQKLDRYRREARDLWSRLGALIAERGADEAPGEATDLAVNQREQAYLDLERRQRGAEGEIADRIRRYLPYLEGRGAVLDLGCGRGEALRVFTDHGIEARGVDASAAMVERCRDQGLDARRGDLLEAVRDVPEGSLGAVVSFHVIEHLPTEMLDPLVRLAWRALEPGGVLILETPSPLSIVMAARNFWTDPTHRRPVHPASLEALFRDAGFEPVTRLDLHPFPNEDRLPEIDLEALPEDQRALADQVNRLRDVVDDLLFGDRDFAMVGVRPG